MDATPFREALGGKGGGKGEGREGETGEGVIWVRGRRGGEEEGEGREKIVGVGNRGEAGGCRVWGMVRSRRGRERNKMKWEDKRRCCRHKHFLCVI